MRAGQHTLAGLLQENQALLKTKHSLSEIF